MNKTVAIHQPNFFPWLGYFDKINRADIFLFFDDVQFPKTGGVWCNRVKCLISRHPFWMTAAIDRNYSGTRQIREMHFLKNDPWRDKMLKRLEVSYCKHPFYSETMAVIEPLVLNSESNIAEYNIFAVTKIAHQMSLDITKLRRSSEFVAEGSSNELLCELTMMAGGSTYICGGGADGYQEDAIFAKSRINLQHQNFNHPIYPQFNYDVFEPGLSIIDAAMNLGWRGIGDLLSGSQC
jgi:hypothetical protein